MGVRQVSATRADFAGTRTQPAQSAIAPHQHQTTPPPRKLACRVSKNFDAVADHYKQHRWAFIEDVFENDYYEALKNNFPPRRFFRPVAFLEKSYDMLVVSDDTVRSLDSFPELQSLYSLFKSEPFCARIQAITGQQEREMRHSGPMIVTRTWPGTYVIPHKDSAYNDDSISSRINCMFFVDGTGGENSGGLALAGNNELEDVIFNPVKLKNTCLIYDVKADFYHGFPPVAPGKFRHAIAMFWESREAEDDH